MAQVLIALAALFGFLGVAFGAFGAHALRDRLGLDMLGVWETAVQYQFWHTLALLAVGLMALRAPSPSLAWAGGGFALGIVLFSGSLYVLALSGIKGLGAITPIGGLAFLMGWAALLWTALRLP